MSDERAIILQSVYHIKHASKFINENKKMIIKILSRKEKKILADNFYYLKNAIQFGLKIPLKWKTKKDHLEKYLYGCLYL